MSDFITGRPTSVSGEVVTRPTLVPANWKKIIARVMEEWKIIPVNFTGKIEMDFHQGGVTTTKIVTTIR